MIHKICYLPMKRIFHIFSFANRHNMRYWIITNFTEFIEKPFHNSKVMIWCGVSSRGVIDFYFFENENGKASKQLTVIDNIEILKNVVKPELTRKKILSKFYFQQDGVISHICNMHIEKNVQE